MSLHRELESCASSGRAAFVIVENLFAKIIATLQRDSRFASATRFELELLFADLHRETERLLFNEVHDRVHVDDARNLVRRYLPDEEDSEFLLESKPMPTLFWDIETRSTVPLEDAGAWRYAADPISEVLCVGYAVDESAVKIWTPGQAIRRNSSPPRAIRVGVPLRTTLRSSA